MWMDPHETGLYLGQCAQYCGTQHAKMLLRVYVQTRDEFDRWIQEQSQPALIGASFSAGQRIFERTACVNCHAVAGTAANGRFGPDLTHLMSRDTIASGAVREHSGKSAALDSGSRCVQTGIQNAGHGIERSGFERSDRVSGDSSLMSTESIAWPVSETAPPPLVDRLHQWVTTVDHKRLGILYIVYALVFLLIGGVGSDHHAHPAHSSA